MGWLCTAPCMFDYSNTAFYYSRLIHRLRKVLYEEILRLMDLLTLSYQRLREDAIETYKLVHG